MENAMNRNMPGIKIYKKAILTFLLLFALCAIACTVLITNKMNVENLQIERLILEKSYTISEVISKQLYQTKALAALVIHGDGSVHNFQETASVIMDRDSAVANLLLAPNGIVSDVYPFEENKAAIGLNLLDVLEHDGNREAIQAYELGDLVMAGPFMLRQGHLGVSGRYPVFIKTETGKGKFWGLVSVALKFPQVLDGTGLSMLEYQGLSFELWRINPDTGEKQVLAGSDKPSGSRVSFVERPVKIHHAEWYFRIAPTRSWYGHPEMFFIFFAGLCISFAGAILVHHNMKLAATKLDFKNQTRTLNKMAATLITKRDKTFDAIMAEGFGLMAEIVDIDRMSVWRNSMNEDGVHISQIYRFGKPFGATEILNEFDDISYAEYVPSWEKIFTANEFINSPIRYLSEQNAAILQKFGVVSVFATPIFIDDVFWGIVLFTDHKKERYFEKNHVNFMCSAAFLFASTIIRNEIENKVAEASKFNNILIENAPIGITIFDEELNVINYNDTILNMLSASGKKYHNFMKELSPEYQPDGTNSVIKAFEMLERTMAGEKHIFEWVHKSNTDELIPCEVTTMRAKYGGKTIGIGYTYDLRHVKSMEKKVTQLELELLESKISIMLSQIQPHFLNNALTAIAQLCEENPAKAKKTTIDFSKYIRCNLESLSNKSFISIENELNHVRHYLDLESAIYGSALNVVYNIEVANFQLPPLTIQPIVENAVKHGVCSKEGGGTITLSICETDSEYVVNISDDGNGFDTNILKDAHKHIGINNVRLRLKEQCKGTLEIFSEIGYGTTAVIKIPKGK